MATKHNDKPLGNIKRVKIENEVNQDPALYPLANGHLVEFPDVFDMPLEEAENFFDELNRAQAAGKVTPILKKWLSKEDYAELVAEYSTPRKIKPVFEAIMSYYEGIWGDAGEGSASES